MKSRSRLAITIGGIVGGSLLAFCCGLLLTVVVIVPVREGRGFPPRPPSEPTAMASPSVGVGPIARGTPIAPSPTPTYSIILSSPTPWSSDSSPGPSATFTVAEQPTTAPPPTATQPRFPFYYVEGSRLEQPNCDTQYLKGSVVGDNDVPIDGVTIRYERWGESQFYVSGSDPNGPRGYWTFDYMPVNRNMATDFVLEVVESADNPVSLSEPLQIHYVNCGIMGQITNIVFKHY